MATSQSTLETKNDEAVRFLEILTDEVNNNVYWQWFIRDLFPNLHRPTFIRMDLAIDYLDEVLFNNVFLKSDISIKYTTEDRDWSPGSLGETMLHPNEDTISVKLCVERHDNDPLKVLRTLLHELCHVHIMIITENVVDSHGAIWQKLAMAVEETMTRLMGRKVYLGRRLNARAALARNECPHFSELEIEEFFSESTVEKRDNVPCTC